MECSICKKDKNIITHHLSYEPEIITTVCWNCHFIMHRIAEKPQDQQDIIIGWIKQYGHLWNNGFEKYRKSEHRKNKHREYRQTDKYKNYFKERRFKKLSPEKMLERISKMEKKLNNKEK